MDRPLPSGTLTLMFTDIEGSSRLWDTHRSGMAEALTQHNEILRKAIAERAGLVVKDKGDGFFAVFVAADEAVRCAVEIQQQVHRAEWPADTGRLKIRMALHTGSVADESGDYHGPVVNRVARLEGTAHGDQVVVSEITRTLALDGLPADVSFRDLGVVSLRGMDRPERVYQLVAPELPDVFPPLRTESGGGVALPAYPTSFVGRESDRQSIEEMFAADHARLVTLLGPGGIGKTRLAVETARQVGESLDGGSYFVDLARISDPADVGLAIAEAVGAHPEGTASPVSMAAARLGRTTMLVLDNFEHVQTAATTVAELLDASGSVQLIATSRSPLHIRGEQVYRVEPLGSASGNGSLPPAAALFYERAAGHGVDLQRDGSEAEAVRRIVERLDGLPLAIELVAARTRLIGIAELESMLDESLDAFGSGAADLPDRQRTIRSTIGWSLQTLSDSQHDLFTRLSVFPAGATLAQLEAVTERSKAALLDDVGALVDNSLVNVVTGLPGGTRYRQLVLMRDYGGELLAEAGQVDETMGRLLDYYQSIATDLGAQLQISEDSHRATSADHANLAEVMSWSLEHDRVDDMVEFVGDIWVYWFNGDLASKAVQWVERAVPLLDSVKLDWLVGFFALQAGDFETAHEKLASSLVAFSQTGHDEWVGRCQFFLAMMAEDTDEAERLASEAIAVFDGGIPGADLFMAKLMQSVALQSRGQVEESIQIRRSLVDWANERQFLTMIAWSEWNLALALLADDQDAAAAEHNQRSLEHMADAGYQEGVASAADVAAAIKIRSGDLEEGLRILGGAESIWQAIASYRWPESAQATAEALDMARQALGEEADRLLAEGRQLSIEQLAELASIARSSARSRF